MLRYREIKKLLAAEIAEMNINDRLPSRPELCKRLDTTRMTLDKAINELVTEGLLFSRKGGGTYVANANDASPVYKGNWGVIVPDVTEEFYSKVVRGVENFAQRHGINLILCNSDYDFDKQEQYIKRLDHSGISGFILVPVVGDNVRLNHQLTELKVPFVFCTRNAEGISAPVVSSDNYYGGYIATKHLLAKGYRNIAYIYYLKYRTSVERCQGYIAALLENGIEINQKIIVMEKSQAQPYGYEAMKKILASGQMVDAVFCVNDKTVLGVYRAITEAGLTVSDDIGVIGYDNSDICDKSIPAITSVDFRNLEVGTKAAEVLYKQISGESLADFEYYLFQPELVVRDSCLGLNKAEGGSRKAEGVGC
jgi:DNA-binding LacI/PurR family transcriptional regulator